MSRVALEQILYLFDRAFDGREWHSVLANLSHVRDADWLWSVDASARGPGESRTIRGIVMHIAYNKFAHRERSFGGGLDEDELRRLATAAFASNETTVEFLKANHARLRERVAALEDADLGADRMTHRGKLPTREIIAGMIEHDLYHAGEINCLRALKQGEAQPRGESR